MSKSIKRENQSRSLNIKFEVPKIIVENSSLSNKKVSWRKVPLELANCYTFIKFS